MGHHEVVIIVWWGAACGLTVISAALYRYEIAILSAANPATRLPWIGWPANTPRSARLLGFFAVLPLIIVADCVVEALGRRQPYDAL